MSAAPVWTGSTWAVPDTAEQRRIAWLESLLEAAREDCARLRRELEDARHDREMLLADAERLRRELDEATGVVR